jgi:hypothetical protein
MRLALMAFVILSAAAVSGDAIAQSRSDVDRERRGGGGRSDRYDNYRDDQNWQRERKRRRMLRELRRDEERRLYREWIESSTVTCFNDSLPIASIPLAKTVAPTAHGSWPTISFFDIRSMNVRTLGLLSPRLSCHYEHHDPSYASAHGIVQGGFRIVRVAPTPLVGPHVISCYEGDEQVLYQRVAAATIATGGDSLRISFRTTTLQSGPATTIDINTRATTCFVEPDRSRP